MGPHLANQMFDSLTFCIKLLPLLDSLQKYFDLKLLWYICPINITQKYKHKHIWMKQLNASMSNDY